MAGDSSITSDPEVSDLPNFKPSEMGSTGLAFNRGEILEEMKKDLAFPYAAHTYKLMTYDSAVSSALGIIEVLVSRADWKVEPPDNANAEDLVRTEHINSMMGDMDRNWGEYIQEFLSYLIYGHSDHEMVFKRRKGRKPNNKYNSKYDDGLFGWAKLPVRSQSTIDKWIFDPKKSEFVGLRQNLSLVDRQGYYVNGGTYKVEKQERLIPFTKLLRFRWNPKRDNPEGQSPLRGCYISWKYKTTIEEYEAVGVSRDLAGLPVIDLPPEYMAADASDDKKAVYEYMKDLIRNISANQSAGVIMPKFVDAGSKENLFGFRLEGVSGGKSYDTSQIISRYENKILMSFFADILKMGQDSVGSFALSDNKNNLLAFMVESQLQLLADVLNEQLITTTFRINGWDASDKRLPKFTFSDIEDIDLEAVSKYVQRIVAVGAVEVDKPMSDKLREIIDLPPADPAKPLDDKLTAGMGAASRSGDGLSEGLPSGTGKKTGKEGDSSSNNNDNKA
jgi:hypothetical protein